MIIVNSLNSFSEIGSSVSSWKVKHLSYLLLEKTCLIRIHTQFNNSYIFNKFQTMSLPHIGYATRK